MIRYRRAHDNLGKNDNDNFKKHEILPLKRIVTNIRSIDEKVHARLYTLITYNNESSKSDNLEKYEYWAEQLYLHHNIPLNKFQLSKKAENEIQNIRDYFVDLKMPDTSRKNHYDWYVGKYESFFAPALSGLEKFILVYDYLEAIEQKEEKLDAYFKAHENLYRDIQLKLKEKPKLHYTRVIALPLRKNLSASESKTALIAEFLKYCTSILFVHICNCISEGLIHKSVPLIRIPKDRDPNKSERSILSVESGFYLVNKCSRAYQFALLDNYIFTEMYRYNINQVCYPDALFTDKVDAEHPHYTLTLLEFGSLFSKKKNKETGEILPAIEQIVSLNSLNLFVKPLSELIANSEGTPENEKYKQMKRTLKLAQNKTSN